MTPLPRLICIGSVLWDVIGRAPVHLVHGSDVPGRIARVPGGVALNVAMALHRLGLSPALLSAVGRDAEGAALFGGLERLGMDCRWLYRSDDLPTDVYMAIEGANGLIAAIADAHSLEAAGDRILAPLRDGRLGGPGAPFDGVAVLDGNLTTALLAEIAGDPCFAAADLRLAPASPGKAERLLPLLHHPRATFYVNRAEAAILTHHEHATAAAAAQAMLDRGARRVLVTDGAAPACLGDDEGLHEARPPEVMVTRVTGAGDAFLAAHLEAELSGADRQAAMDQALQAAAQHVAGDRA